MFVDLFFLSCVCCYHVQNSWGARVWSALRPLSVSKMGKFPFILKEEEIGNEAAHHLNLRRVARRVWKTAKQRKVSVFFCDTATDPFLQPSGAAAWLGAILPCHGSVQSRPSIDSSHTSVAVGGGAKPRSCLPACRAGAGVSAQSKKRTLLLQTASLL